MQAHVRWEVWVSDLVAKSTWRFNACFDERNRAEEEREWYTRRGYAVELRMRTTRYQQPWHLTTE